LSETRGKGLGKKLIQQCVETAKALGYTSMYIETMPELKNAVGLYESLGFKYLDGPLGESGHFGCDLWMLNRFDDILI
jgi:putative acetyltransferase